MHAPQELTSAKNPQIINARALSDRKGREAQRAFLCEGEHMVQEALSACPQAVQALFVNRERMEKYASLLQAPQIHAAVYTVPERLMAALSQVKAPQGIAAVVALPRPVPAEALGNKLVLLENVQDPGNVGTILRTLDAAGFHGCMLTPGCADPFAPKTLRATMGSVFRVPLAFVQGESSASSALEDTFANLKARGYALLAAELSGAPFYSRGPLPDQLCLMIGNEGVGLTLQAREAATHRFRLPMAGGAESLNAAIAAAVMMYDLMYR